MEYCIYLVFESSLNTMNIFYKFYLFYPKNLQKKISKSIFDFQKMDNVFIVQIFFFEITFGKNFKK